MTLKLSVSIHHWTACCMYFIWFSDLKKKGFCSPTCEMNSVNFGCILKVLWMTEKKNVECFFSAISEVHRCCLCSCKQCCSATCNLITRQYHILFRLTNTCSTCSWLIFLLSRSSHNRWWTLLVLYFHGISFWISKMSGRISQSYWYDHDDESECISPWQQALHADFSSRRCEVLEILVMNKQCYFLWECCGDQVGCGSQWRNTFS